MRSLHLRRPSREAITLTKRSLSTNFTLLHQGLILVSVPLIFELAFVGTLTYLFHQSELERQREAHARDIEHGISDILTQFAWAARDLGSYLMLRSDSLLERYETTLNAMPQRFDHIKSLVKGEPEKMRAVESMEWEVNKGIRWLKEKKAKAEEDGYKHMPLTELKEMQLILNRVGMTTRDLTIEARHIAEASPLLQEQYRHWIWIAICIGIAINILIAVLLAVYFSKTTARRLDILVDNTMRLASDMPLNPPLEGRDEIAHLDRVFNELAYSLNLAAEERKQLEKLKQEFVAMVSHDLKTPLTSVHGSLSLLSSGALGDLSESAKQTVQLAEGEVERLSNLVKDLLDVAKIEAGKLQLHIARVDLVSVIERSIGSMRGFAEKHSVTIEEPKQPKEEIDADGDRLVQVLVNLLSNAIKFSPQGGIVKISVVDRGAEVEVRVQDQGRGIPKTHLKAIFERFHQVEAADDKDKEGTGLGLPICKSIVQQHGGTIGVESEVGKGATFWLRLPRASTPAVSIK